ncbi:hypothetical protein BG011_004967 [Mortierella polycephala]|uniref:Uncharacterized protein n=1 Tax=Mortierella polycephala TaxID=41804 RepID=A0A9P6PWU2_9FUNG|nr:hypothetical protein BG011_004967 [Mortierella polycephala]
MEQGNGARAPSQSIPVPVHSDIIEQLHLQGKAISENIRGRHTKFGNNIAAIIESYGTSIEQDANYIFQEYARTKASLDSSSRDLTTMRATYEALVSELGRIRQAYAISQQEVQRLKSAYSLLFSQKFISLAPQQLQDTQQSQQQLKEKSIHESQEQSQQPEQSMDEERHRAEFQIMAAELLRAMDDVEKLKGEKEILESNWIHAEQARRELVATVSNKTVVNSQLGAILETKQLEINVLRQRIDKLTADLKMSHEFITEYYGVLATEINRRRQHKGLDVIQAAQTLEPGTDAQSQRAHELISTTGLPPVLSQPTAVLLSAAAQAVPASASPVATSAPPVVAMPPIPASAPPVAASFTLSHELTSTPGSAASPWLAAPVPQSAPVSPLQPGPAVGPKMGSFSKAMLMPPNLNMPYKAGPWPPLGSFQTDLHPKASLTAQHHQLADGPRRPRKARQPKKSRAQLQLQQHQTPPQQTPPQQTKSQQQEEQQQGEQQQGEQRQEEQRQEEQRQEEQRQGEQRQGEQRQGEQQQEEQQQAQQSRHVPQTQTQIEASSGLNMQNILATVDPSVEEETSLTTNNSTAPEKPSPTEKASKADGESSAMTGQESSIASNVSAAPKEPSLTEGGESPSVVNVFSTPANVMELSKKTLHEISKIPGLQEQIPLFTPPPSEAQQRPFKRRIIVEEEEEEGHDIHNVVYDSEQRGEPEPKKQQQDRWLLATVDVPSLDDARSKTGTTEGEMLRKMPPQSLSTQGVEGDQDSIQQSTGSEGLTSVPTSLSSAMIISSITAKPSVNPASTDKVTTPTVVASTKNGVTKARRRKNKENNPTQDLGMNFNIGENSAAGSLIAVKAPLTAPVPSVATLAASKENKAPATASNGATNAHVAGTTATSSTKSSKSSKPRKSSKSTHSSTMKSLWSARFPNLSSVLMDGLFGTANGVDNVTPIITTKTSSTKSSVATHEAVVDPEESP